MNALVRRAPIGGLSTGIRRPPQGLRKGRHVLTADPELAAMSEALPC